MMKTVGKKANNKRELERKFGRNHGGLLCNECGINEGIQTKQAGKENWGEEEKMKVKGKRGEKRP
jgi:hypothetical protein